MLSPKGFGPSINQFTVHAITLGVKPNSDTTGDNMAPHPFYRHLLQWDTSAVAPQAAAIAIAQMVPIWLPSDRDHIHGFSPQEIKPLSGKERVPPQGTQWL